MRILVTGARGFIGAGVVRAAHRDGHDLVALDQSTHGRDLPAGVELVIGDITQPEEWRSAFEGIEAVVHCAAIHPIQIAENNVRGIEVNLRGTRLVLEAAADAGVKRFVHLSSAKAYGDPLGFPSREDDIVNPIECYGLSKVATENYCRYFTAHTDMRCIALRPFSVYGPGQEFSTGYVGQLLEAYTIGTPAALSGTPEFIRDFVHIDDVIDVCMASALRDQPFDVVNVGCGLPTTLGELVELFVSLFGTEGPVSFKQARPGTVERTLADLTRLRRVLNRDPIAPTIGLRDTVETYKSGKVRVA